MAGQYYEGVGRRKNSVARVRVSAGTGNFVVNDKHLAAATDFVGNGIADEFFVEDVYLGLDGVAVGWRRGDDGDVAGTHERELQRARDGCSRHGKRIHIDFHLAQFLFGSHAEFLLFIYNKQSQIFENYIFT